jgi:hypothetical protein
MAKPRVCLLLGLMFCLGCGEDKPVPWRDRNAGLSATFPGEPRTNTYTEPTPYGNMEWFSTEFTPRGSMIDGFFVQVGNLPAGDRGGTTAMEILNTYRIFLERRFGKLSITQLPPGQGPGFSYEVQVPSGAFVKGLVVSRRGRLHRAQATTRKAGDPRVQAFLASFKVE